MALVITGTFGLVVWIVLWALECVGLRRTADRNRPGSDRDGCPKSHRSLSRKDR